MAEPPPDEYDSDSENSYLYYQVETNPTQLSPVQIVEVRNIWVIDSHTSGQTTAETQKSQRHIHQYG